jgi:hypothetical protein
MRGKIILLTAAVLAIACAAAELQAAGRGRSGSPYVRTPWGLIPKSVYNAPFVRNPAKLDQYRQREQQMLQQKGGSTATKGRTTTQKK